MLGCIVFYRALLAVSQRQADSSQVLYEYTITMYEYITEALESDGYSSHWESAILATGQGLHSYFLRSKNMTLKDQNFKYSIDTNRSDIQNNELTVNIDGNNGDKSKVSFSYLGLSKLSFWIVGSLINGKEAKSSDNDLMYEQSRNLFTPLPIPSYLPNQEVIIHLKYEPIDWFVLHEIIIDCGTIEKNLLPENLEIFIAVRAEALSTLSTQIETKKLKPVVNISPKSSKTSIIKIKLDKPEVGAYMSIKLTPQSDASQMMLQQITFFGKHKLKDQRGTLVHAQAFTRLMLEVTQSHQSHLETINRDKLNYSILQSAFENQGYKLATLIKMGTVCPILKALTTAHIRNAYSPSTLARLRSESTTNVLNPSLHSTCNYQNINISRCGLVSDDVMEGIIAPSLKSLDLTSNASITDKSIILLAEVSKENLTSLHIGGCVQLTEKSMASLAKHCPNLQELFLWSTASLEALSYLGKLKKLKSLSLAGCSIVASKTLKNISHYCSKIESLDLSDCEITDSDCKKLESLSYLERINLSDCKKITDKGISCLEHCTSLKDISVNHVHVSENSLLGLILQQKSKLTSISLVGCASITNVLVTTIAHHCPNLKKLDVSFISNINDSSLMYVAVNCKNLIVLGASGTQITGASLQLFSKYFCLSLEELYLDDCKNITDTELHFITTLRKLKVLSIQQNHFLTPQTILQVLNSLTLLKILDISDCSLLSDITVLKIKHLSPSLQVKYHLRSKYIK